MAEKGIIHPINVNVRQLSHRGPLKKQLQHPMGTTSNYPEKRNWKNKNSSNVNAPK